MYNPKIDEYFEVGCGRCSLGGTPQCKALQWTKEFVLMREIILSCGLIEELKWSVPCYTFNGSNILIMAGFKDYCSIAFFKGALLSDPLKKLQFAGENSQSSKMFRFTNVTEIAKMENAIKEYIFEAIELEKSGAKVAFKKIEDYAWPEELEAILKKDKVYKKAFESLTPGRQRGYLMHFSQPKQVQTKIDRINKAKEKVMLGKGLNDY